MTDSNVAITPDSLGTGIAGEDFDPYAGQETDDFLPNPLVLLCHIIGLIYKPAIAWSSYFPPHNYRQWHIIEQSLTVGFNAPSRDSTVGKLLFPKIPVCPKLWQDVSHYWNFGAAIGILVYEFLAHIRIVIVIFALWNLAKLGTISVSDAYTILLQQIGITF